MRVKRESKGQNMSGMPEIEFDRASVELLFQERKFEDAMRVLFQCLSRNPQDLETKLYVLLAKVQLYGPEPYEEEIDSLRGLFAANDRDRELIRRVFLLGYEAAEKASNQGKMWAYQRLLRRLILGQPLDWPIPITPKQSTSPTPEIQLGPPISAPDPASKLPGETARKIPGPPKEPMIKNFGATLPLALGIAVLLSVPIAYFVSGKNRLSARQTTETQITFPLATGASEDTLSAVDATGVNPEIIAPEAPEQELFLKLVTDQLSNLRRAYARWTAKDDRLAGNLLIKLTVDPSGKVVRVDKIASDLMDNNFVQVVMAEARKWNFPKGSNGATEFTISLQFVPDDLKPMKLARTEQRLKPEQNRDAAPLAYTVRIHQAVEAVTKAQPFHTETGATEQIKPVSERAEKVGDVVELPMDYKTGRAITLREYPRFASGSVQSIDVGTQIRVLEAEGDWLKVKSQPSGVTGYVRKELLVSPAPPR